MDPDELETNDDAPRPRHEDAVTTNRREDTDAGLVVDLDQADDEDDTPDEALGDDQRLSRKERRRARYQEVARKADEAAERLEEERQRRAELEQRIAFIEGRTAQNANREDPYAARLKQLRAEEDAIYDQFNDARHRLSPEQIAALKDKAYALREAQAEVVADRRMAQRHAEMMNANPNAAVEQMLAAEFPDVWQNPKAIEWAKRIGEARVLAGEAPRGVETARKVLAEARIKFGSGGDGRRPVDDKTRRHYAGTPKGASGGASDGKVTLNAQEVRMARAMYPGLSARDAGKKWLKATGRANR